MLITRFPPPKVPSKPDETGGTYATMGVEVKNGRSLALRPSRLGLTSRFQSPSAIRAGGLGSASQLWRIEARGDAVQARVSRPRPEDYIGKGS